MSIRRLALLCLAILLAPRALAQDWRLYPDARRKVEARGAMLVDAINADDPTARTAAIERLYAPDVLASIGVERMAAQMARITDYYGVMEFGRAELVEGQQGDTVWRVLHAYARNDRTGKWLDLQIRVDASPPYLLREIAFIAEVAEPVALPNGDIDNPDTLAWLHDYIDKLVDSDDLAGSILIAKGDQILIERYVGFADAARTRPIDANTRSNLGSGNKMFTALSVALLERDGALDYSDPIAKYFADFPDQQFAKKATIGHLLSHTSGVAEYWTPATTEALTKVKTTADVLPIIYAAGIDFQPGEQHRYSNSNFILAGLIVEQVSGVSYLDFVRSRITGPLDLKNTDHFRIDNADPTLAQRLTRDGDAWVPAPSAERGTSAGGGFATPRDILTFSRALAASKIVPRDTLALMTTSKTASIAGAEGDYGYGFILERHGNVASYGHGGMARGVNFEFRYFPTLDITLVMFCNQDNGAYDSLRRNAVRLITGDR